MSDPDRRGFLVGAGRGLSGGFLFGAAGGIGVGAVGGAMGMDAYSTANRLPFKTSYSQQGEDMILASFFHFWLKVPSPTYLDIGAHDPIVDSNTYYFYTAGSRGVLVEPNPDKCRRLRAARPRDTVLEVGIGIAGLEGEVDYYLIGGPGSNGGQNTFSKEIAESYEKKTNGRRYITEVIKKPLIPIKNVLEEHFHGKAPDYLSIDTEGLDLDILKTVDFDKYRPLVICVETLTGDVSTPLAQFIKDRRDEQIMKFMESKGYSICGDTFVNSIFVDNRSLKGGAG